MSAPRLALDAAQRAEFNITRTYLDWLVSIPWGISTDENFDVEHAKGVLDKVRRDRFSPCPPPGMDAPCFRSLSRSVGCFPPRCALCVQPPDASSARTRTTTG